MADLRPGLQDANVAARAATAATYRVRARRFLFAGLTIFFTGVVVTGLQGAFSTVSAAICVVGLLLGAVTFVPRVTRNLPLYANTVLYSFFVIASAVLVFLMVRRHPVTLDVTRDRINSISAVSKDFLSRLDSPIRVTGFFTETDRDQAAQLLREYERYSPQIEYRLFHPFRDVTEARRYGGSILPGDIFVETLTTDTKTVARSVRIQGLSEERITNAIVQALRGEQVVLYFLTGHGEPSLESDRAAALLAGRNPRGDDLTWLSEQLDRSHIIVRPLALSQKGRVPTDASAVIVASPRIDITSAERTALKAYLESGGRALFCIGPSVAPGGTTLNNVKGLLADYGIDMPETVVVLARGDTEGDRFTIPATSTGHRINTGDSGQPLPLAQARPVRQAEIPRPNVSMDTILLSPDGAAAIPSAQIVEAVQARRPLNMTIAPDAIGVQPLGVGATLIRPGVAEDKAAKLVVIGSASFLQTSEVRQEGWLLFLNAINWMTSTADLIAVPTASVENTPMELTAGQKRFIFLLVVIIVPTLIALGGLGYSLLRRELA